MRGDDRAPVWPAVTSADAWPSRTRPAATITDERGLRRSASAADSSMSDDVGRIDDRDVERLGVGMAHELVADPVGLPYQVDADAEMPRGGQGTVDGTPGRMIAAHGVDRDAHWLGADYSSSTGRTWRAR